MIARQPLRYGKHEKQALKPAPAIYDEFLIQSGGEQACKTLIEAFPEIRLCALNARPRTFWLGYTPMPPYVAAADFDLKRCDSCELSAASERLVPTSRSDLRADTAQSTYKGQA